MYSIFAKNVQNCVGFWDSAPDPAGGAYDAPPDPLVGRGFLPLAIAASRLRRLQFPRLTCLRVYAKTLKFPPPPWRLQHLDFSTSNMSHYLKSLKTCPGLSASAIGLNPKEELFHSAD